MNLSETDLLNIEPQETTRKKVKWLIKDTEWSQQLLPNVCRELAKKNQREMI